MRDLNEAEENSAIGDFKAHLAQELEAVRTGQRLILMAAVFLLVVDAVQKAVRPSSYFEEVPFAFAGLAVIVMCCMGFFRIMHGSGFSFLVSALVAVCFFVPVLNVIVFICLLIQSVRVLRASGYPFGLFLAKRRVGA